MKERMRSFGEKAKAFGEKTGQRSKELGKKVAEATKETTAKAADATKKTTAKVAEAAKETTAKAAEAGKKAGSRLSESTADVSEKISVAAEQAVESVSKGVKQTKEKVKQAKEARDERKAQSAQVPQSTQVIALGDIPDDHLTGGWPQIGGQRFLTWMDLPTKPEERASRRMQEHLAMFEAQTGTNPTKSIIEELNMDLTWCFDGSFDLDCIVSERLRRPIPSVSMIPFGNIELNIIEIAHPRMAIDAGSPFDIILLSGSCSASYSFGIVTILGLRHHEWVINEFETHLTCSDFVAHPCPANHPLSDRWVGMLVEGNLRSTYGQNMSHSPRASPIPSLPFEVETNERDRTDCSKPPRDKMEFYEFIFFMFMWVFIFAGVGITTLNGSGQYRRSTAAMSDVILSYMSSRWTGHTQLESTSSVVMLTPCRTIWETAFNRLALKTSRRASRWHDRRRLRLRRRLRVPPGNGRSAPSSRRGSS